MNDNKKSYYAIIPASVRYDPDLCPNSKLLYGEITALCNEKGFCWASNEYFGNLYGVHKNTISKWISQLKDKGYINIEIEKSYERKLWIHEKLKWDTQKDERGIHEKLKWDTQKDERGIHEKLKGDTRKAEDNNTINNTINNTYTQIFNLWNQSENLQKHNNICTFTNKFSKNKLTQILKEYSLEDIEHAIKNYNIVLGHSDYYFTYKWALWDFLTRGLDKFVPSASPLVNFIKKKEIKEKSYKEQVAELYGS